jgi:hypothetical protein
MLFQFLIIIIVIIVTTTTITWDSCSVHKMSHHSYSVKAYCFPQQSQNTPMGGARGETMYSSYTFTTSTLDRGEW